MADTTKTQGFLGLCSFWFRKLTATKVGPWPQLPFVDGTGIQKKSTPSSLQRRLPPKGRQEPMPCYHLWEVQSGAAIPQIIPTQVAIQRLHKKSLRTTSCQPEATKSQERPAPEEKIQNLCPSLPSRSQRKDFKRINTSLR